MQQEHGIWVVEDWRKDHRRRLDRITGATVEPTCIILGSTNLDKDPRLLLGWIFGLELFG